MAGGCQLSRGDKFCAQVLVYEPEKALPYKKDELDKAKDFLAEITGEVSQRHLAEKLETHSIAERYGDGSSSFVYGGYWATSEDFRDGDDYSVSAILDTDLDEVENLIKQHKPIDGFIVPIPKQYRLENFENRPKDLPKYLAIASSQFYSEARGFGK